MFQALLIVGRESVELLLVCLALREWAFHAERPALVRWIAAGVPVGLAAAAAVIAMLPPSGMNEWVDIALTCGFGLSIALLSCGTMASMSGIGDHVAARFDAFFARRAAALPVFLFVAFSALREALESFLLLRFVAANHGTEAAAWGIVLGLVACALLAAAWGTLEGNRRTHIVFRLSAVLLFVLGVQMVLEALAEALMRGVAGGALTQVGRALSPYLENGDRQWVLCAALAVIPLAVWMRAWWRRARV
ncbi:hypothetical protein [Variovorax sp. JS1663]|uniref:hypothetical protein n=1 Tax=Variovorax sp. JS1663 TaxID=1851577 RepID=UPI000B6B1D50|nr:hypothetical protein [Variovorax sp. JS1663]OUM01999.1 hypothetical protein A8M77_12870 [Variovorax sp. JS1663]